MGSKRPIGKALFYVAFIIAAGVFLFSGYQIFDYYREINGGEQSADRLKELAVSTVETSAAPENGDNTAQEESEQNIPRETAPIEVDFQALRQESEDIVGWIYCEDTPISYPVVQGDDNDEYLRNLPDGSWNYSGSIFMDYRNAPDLSDWNTLIYGHNLYSETMFGTLMSYRDQAYFDAHPVMYLLTPKGSFRVDVMAGATVPVSHDVFSVPMTRAEKETFADEIGSMSVFSSGRTAKPEDSLVTLSTCTNVSDAERFILVGILHPLDQ